MSKHTPGPWEYNDPAKFNQVDGRFSYTAVYARGNAFPWRMAEVQGPDDKTTIANARLIAAAPAMELALSMISCGVARIERCGRLEEFCFDGIRYCLNGDWNALFNVIGWNKAHAAIAKATGDGS